MIDNKTGCRFITVDALASAVPFYEKNNFIPLNDEDINDRTRLLYFDLNDLKWYCCLAEVYLFIVALTAKVSVYRLFRLKRNFLQS